MIVWLASFPRSGNTFFRMLLFYKYGIPTTSIYNEPDLVEIGATEAVGHYSLPKPIPELANENKMYIIKTHELPTDNYPTIYLVRDGRDALVSHARYFQKFYGKATNPVRKLKQLVGWENFNRTLRNIILTSNWSTHIVEWTSRSDQQVFIVPYEKLCSDPDFWLDQAITSLQLPIQKGEEQEMPNFEELKEKWPQFFRKGKISSWKEEMPKHLHELFWKHHEQGMKVLGYEK